MINRKQDFHEQDPEGTEQVERRLRESRPEASEQALARARLLALAANPEEPVRARRAPTAARPRTRLAIAALLATGMLMSGSGAALGISGINSSGSAGSAQYVPPTGTNTVLGTETEPQQTEPTNTTPGQTGTQETAPTTTGNDPGVVREAQPVRQVQATTAEKELPFTGLAAIPVIMCGIALLVAGAVLRRRSREV
jgi:hypothetical protein